MTDNRKRHASVTRIVFLLASASALASCGSTPALEGGPNVKVQADGNMPAPQRADLATFERPYLIGPFDKLKIDVFGIQELSDKEVQVDASGRLSFPLTGSVEASGKTPTELAQLLEEQLRGRYVRNPQVTVNLEETVSQVITVDGQVKEPGPYPVLGRMTLMRAIARAKGAGEFARLDDVVIFRTVQGQRMAALYNLQAFRRGAYDDPEVFANDVVIVGESGTRKIFQNFLTTASLLTAPLVVLLQNL
jgi:polysaccharide export outer membrane protein